MDSRIEKARVEVRGRSRAGKRITVSSILPCSADTAWKEVLRTGHFTSLIFPMALFWPRDRADFPEQWEEGQELEGRTFLYGFIPFGGMRTLQIQRVDHENKELWSHEFDRMVQTWDHHIKVEAMPGNNQSCRYTDEILLYAGRWTDLVARWCRAFYRFRQRKWQRIAARLHREEDVFRGVFGQS